MSGLFEDDQAEGLPSPPVDGPGLFGGDPPPPEAPASPPAQAAAYRVLARKYRPTRFADLIGQEAMVRTLRNAFALDRVAHAFMLTGVRGVGKTTTGRIIARALNCVGPDGQGGPTADPCGVCPNCVAILADRHPDVMEMDAASRTGVDDVREIIEATRFRPLQARTKVFIIDEIHMLSRHAFNALLKTLEEPPPHVKFVFATTEIRKVPVTVLSRCQRFDLRRVSIEELSAHFTRVAAAEGVSITGEAVRLIARAADGSVRDGLSLLDQAIALVEDAEITDAAVGDMLGLADRASVFDLLERLMAGSPAEALAITDRAYARGADLGVVLQDLLDLTHTVTRLKTVPELRDGPDLTEAERTRGAALADRLSFPQLGRVWQMLLKGIGEVEAAPDRRAAAEMVLIRLCHVADLPTPGELVRQLSSRPTSQGDAPAPPRPAPGGPGMRGMASGGGAARAAAAPSVSPDPQSAPSGPRLTSFRDVVAFVESQREPTLHAHLLHSVHLVRFAPPVIEIRPQATTPRDLAGRLAALLQRATGTRWTIALSGSPGEPTIAEQGAAATAARLASVSDHPLVQAILTAFPGAKIDTVHDANADLYGLPAKPASLIEPDVPAFAPPDAEPVDDALPPWEID